MYIAGWVENEANPPDEGTRRAKNAAAAAVAARAVVTRNIASQINARAAWARKYFSFGVAARRDGIPRSQVI
jgi:hypothetical protein